MISSSTNEFEAIARAAGVLHKTDVEGERNEDGTAVVRARWDGQQRGYVILSAEERAKGFVRPVRRNIVHADKKCGAVTTMSIAIAETQARDPKFYTEHFCVRCGKHFAAADFTWELNVNQTVVEKVGT